MPNSMKIPIVLRRERGSVLPLQDWLDELPRIVPDDAVLSFVGPDPLTVRWFGWLVKALPYKWEVTSALDWPGFTTLRANPGSAERCIGVGVWWVAPKHGGVASSRMFSRRIVALITAGFPIGRVFCTRLDDGAREGFQWHDALKSLTYEVAELPEWVVRMRQKGAFACDGAHSVIGPDLKVYPCVQAAIGGPLQKGAYGVRGKFRQVEVTKCRFTRCPHGYKEII